MSNHKVYFSSATLILVVNILVLNCFFNGGVLIKAQAQAQTLLPDNEVRVLQQIATKLQISDWRDVNRTSCNSTITIGTGPSSSTSNITCDCSFNSSTVCHVTNILLKGLNLYGELPDDFADLTFLRELDLARNNLNGTIPKSWAILPLYFLSLLGNNIGGSIPKEIRDIQTLEELVLEDTPLGGPIPPEIGNLSRLKRFLASGTNLTGVLPPTLGDLKNLTDFRIDGTGISGRIPDFIGNWTNMTRLDMQGTSMEGPIPSTIFSLTNLKYLRVSDLKGPSVSFPGLQNMKEMSELVLRNCLINGPIPSNIGQMMPKLKVLDLSFNRLTGIIPGSLQEVPTLEYMYLTNNSLTGPIPSWILNTKFKFDVSYNNFTGSSQSICQDANLNKIASYSATEDRSIAWCLKKDLPCPRQPKYYSLFINCGGPALPFEGKEYEADLSTMGPSTFFASTDKWAYSSTGHFVGNSSASFITVGNPNMANRDLYSTARLAAISLKYYGLCLRQGSYNVKLHFSEIMLVMDNTSSIHGRRMFDVSIQDNLVLKDFNIVKEAGGVRKNVTRAFNVNVTGSTLEIHLYWAGKGTTASPFRNVYGPLISAITVTPNFDTSTSTGLSVGVIVGIVIGSCAVILLILALLWWKGILGGKDLEDKELRALELQTGYFSLRQIKAATGNFDPANKIGEGGFGPVYKGVLPDGSVIAVKQLSAKSKQGNREFINEIGMISALQHQNLVKLFGCCIEGNQLLLIYEYLENNSLARALFGREEQRLNLNWATRRKICLEIAKGLTYLHEESRLKIVHRDIKATNVLLDKDLCAKISDFGLAKLDEEENTHISTRIAGTIWLGCCNSLGLVKQHFTDCLRNCSRVKEKEKLAETVRRAWILHKVLPEFQLTRSGYMAPEYAMRGYLTYKADVYSFGVVTLEIVSGKSNTNYRPKEEFVYLLDWAYVLQEQGNLLDLVDPVLGSNYSKEEALRMLNLALLCTNPSPSLRPLMSAVVGMLEGKIPVQAPIVMRNTAADEMRFKAFERISQDSQTQMSSFSQESHTQRSTSIDTPWLDSSSVSSNSKYETRDVSMISKSASP